MIRILSVALLIALAGCGAKESPKGFALAHQGLYDVVLSADGHIAVIGSLHHGASYWTLSPPERHFDWNHQSEGYSTITSVSLSADGRYAATTDKRTLVRWRVDTGQAVGYWSTPADVQDIQLNGDGSLVLMALTDYSASLFDVANGGIKQRFGHDGVVYDVSLSANGLMAASASDDLTARVWNTNNGAELARMKHGNQVRLAQLSADGSRLFTSALNERGKVWDIASGKIMYELGKGRGHYPVARFCSDGRRLVTGHSSGFVQEWQLSDGKQLREWRPGGGMMSPPVQVMAVSCEGKSIRAVTADGVFYNLR